MNRETKQNSSPANENWDAYWQGTAEAEAWSSGGAQHPAVRGFWGQFFTSAGTRFEEPSLVDIGSGNGAVAEYALAILGDRISGIHCVDSSPSAMANVEMRLEKARGLVADARSIPLESGSFDIVTSQFGAEYAGPGAFEEAVRLLATNGLAGFMVHNRDGQIYEQCLVNRLAVARVREAGLLERATRMFKAGFEAVRGADREAYDRAAGELAPIIQLVESIMTEHGQDVADGTLARLYSDIAKIHGRMQHYDPEEVLSWLSRMENELETYQGRMVSMCNSAIDETGFRQLCESLTGDGLKLEESGPLYPVDSDAPLAWVIIATR